jgi:hypothetical protein
MHEHAVVTDVCTCSFIYRWEINGIFTYSVQKRREPNENKKHSDNNVYLSKNFPRGEKYYKYGLVFLSSVFPSPKPKPPAGVPLPN